MVKPRMLTFKLGSRRRPINTNKAGRSAFKYEKNKYGRRRTINVIFMKYISRYIHVLYTRKFQIGMNCYMKGLLFGK